jgi:predicted phage terminase large subunit-like protein
VTIARLVLPKAHPAQAEVAEEAGRRNVLCCGRRWGKSLFVFNRLLTTPGLGLLAGKNVGWFAATNRISDEVWHLAKVGLAPITKRKDEQHRVIETVLGSKIDVWSMESMGVGLGRRYGVVAIDEAAIVKDLKARWMREIRPTLTDYAGAAWLLSTPRGKTGDFYDLWTMGQVPGARWRSWRMPSVTNPYLLASEIEDAKAEYDEVGRPDLFRQEYLAEFVVAGGAIFRPEMVHDLGDERPKLDFRYAGIDPALTEAKLNRGDETAIAVLGIDADARWILDDLIHGRWASDGVVDQTWSMWERHSPQVTWLEGGPAGKGIEPWLRRKQDDARKWWALEMMSHMMEKLAKNAAAAAMVNSGRLWVDKRQPWWPKLEEQLGAFRGLPTDADDLVDALGIVVRGAQSLQGSRPAKPPEPPARGPRDPAILLAHRRAEIAKAAQKPGPKGVLRR